MKRVLFIVMIFCCLLVQSCDDGVSLNGSGDKSHENSDGTIVGTWWLKNSYKSESAYLSYADPDSNILNTEMIVITSDSVVHSHGANPESYDAERVGVLKSKAAPWDQNQKIYYLDSDETYLLTLESDGTLKTFEYDYATGIKTWDSDFCQYEASFPPAEWDADLEEDSFEPDNGFGEARSIKSKESHSIHLRDRDCYKVEAELNRSFTVKMSNITAPYPYFAIKLYDSDFNIIKTVPYVSSAADMDEIERYNWEYAGDYRYVQDRSVEITHLPSEDATFYIVVDGVIGDEDQQTGPDGFIYTKVKYEIELL